MKLKDARCRMQGEAPGHPVVPVLLHLLPGGQAELPLDQLDDPEGAYLEHRVRVVPGGGCLMDDEENAEEDEKEDANKDDAENANEYGEENYG